MKKSVYHPLPTNMVVLRRKIKSEFESISDVMVTTSILDIKIMVVSGWNVSGATMKGEVFKHLS